MEERTAGEEVFRTILQGIHRDQERARWTKKERARELESAKWDAIVESVQGLRRGLTGAELDEACDALLIHLNDYKVALATDAIRLESPPRPRYRTR